MGGRILDRALYTLRNQRRTSFRVYRIVGLLSGPCNTNGLVHYVRDTPHLRRPNPRSPSMPRVSSSFDHLQVRADRGVLYRPRPTGVSHYTSPMPSLHSTHRSRLPTNLLDAEVQDHRVGLVRDCDCFLATGFLTIDYAE